MFLKYRIFTCAQSDFLGAKIYFVGHSANDNTVLLFCFLNSHLQMYFSDMQKTNGYERLLCEYQIVGN